MSSNSDPTTPKRNGKKKKNFRTKKSTIVDDTANKEVVLRRLFFGFNDINHIMRCIQGISLRPRSIILPISTRAIGFITRSLVSKFSRLGIRELKYHNFCCALYRISLLMLDIKVMKAMSNHTSMNVGSRLFRNIDINEDLIRVTAACTRTGFCPLINLLSAVGVFKHFGCEYIPRYANQTVLNQQQFWDPTMVTFCTLREYVQALSNEATPQPIRQYFYDHSPFPNALWNEPIKRQAVEGEPAVDEAFPILQNPDHIMPANYDLNRARSDVIRIMDAFDIVGRKYDKYVFTGCLDCNADGNETQLVSNEIEDIRCSNLTPELSYSTQSPLEGTVHQFWSSEVVSNLALKFGIFHLVGELPESRTKTDAWGKRAIEAASLTCYGDYSGCITNFLG